MELLKRQAINEESRVDLYKDDKAYKVVHTYQAGTVAYPFKNKLTALGAFNTLANGGEIIMGKPKVKKAKAATETTETENTEA